MNSSSYPVSPLRFGVFELNPETGELRKQGLRIKLSHRASKVLLSLLETPGRSRTREELRQQLWPNGMFVDFDHRLNKVIHSLREALGDSATNPRFIETVAGQGYRFIPIVQEASGPAPKLRSSRKVDSVAVLPFETQNGDADMVFIGGQITSRVIDALSKISGVRVLAYNTVKHYKWQEASPRQIGEDLGVHGVVFGELVRHDSDLLLHVELIDLADGTQLWGAQLRHNCQSVVDCSEQAAREVLQHLRPILVAVRTSAQQEGT